MNWDNLRIKIGKKEAEAPDAHKSARSLAENRLISWREDLRLWFNRKSSKRRTRIIGWIALIVLILVAMLILKGREQISSKSANQSESKPVEQKKVEVQLDSTMGPETWQAGAAQDVGMLKKEVAALREAFENKSTPSATPDIKDPNAASSGDNPEMKKDGAPEVPQEKKPKEELPTHAAYPEAPATPPGGGAYASGGAQAEAPSGNGLSSMQADKRIASPSTSKLIHMDMDTSPASAEGDKKKDKSMPVKDMIPVGTFFKATLINGLDVGTGMKAMKQPQPVILRADDLSFMPNNYKKDLQGCFMTGEAAGSLSDERANLRINHLSCIKKNGELIDQDVNAFVSGEDGKLGLRGKLVSKQGIYLSRALMASFAKGIAEMFKYQATTVMVNPFGGQTQTVAPSEAFRAGAGKGAGDAVERLADMYMKYAEDIFPVIEINPGRKVHVVFLQKAEIAPKEKMWE